MEETIESLLSIINYLHVNRFTGQIVLNFHNGDISHKIEKKESMDLQEVPK